MFQSLYGLVPVATSAGGMCLTAQNWREAKVNCLSYSMEALLVKPSLSVLSKISSLKHYVGWSGALILNAASMITKKSGDYQVVSSFDGSKTLIDSETLIRLMFQLRPDAVVMPKGLIKNNPDFWATWPAGITPFIAAEEQVFAPSHIAFGVYLKVNAGQPYEEILGALKPWKDVPCYLLGACSEFTLGKLIESKLAWVESDLPVDKAYQGHVYSSDGILDLKDKAFEMVFEPIDSHCSCPTCMQGFTQAYLHHLYSNTPLLSQRFLIQHNLAIWQGSV